MICKHPSITKGKWPKLRKVSDDALLRFFKIWCDIPDCSMFGNPLSSRTIWPSFHQGGVETRVALQYLQACENKTFYRILEGY